MSDDSEFSLSEKFRTKAVDCERRADEADDSNLRAAWVEVASEWHLLAAMAAAERSIRNSQLESE